MARLVMKFGGTSVADIDRIRNVARHVKREVDAGHEVAVVVSAMAGKTNELVGWCRDAAGLHDAREYDAVVASGEQVTTGLLAIALQDLGIAARSWQGWQLPILTTNAHGAARILDCGAQPALAQEAHRDPRAGRPGHDRAQREEHAGTVAGCLAPVRIDGTTMCELLERAQRERDDATRPHPIGVGDESRAACIALICRHMERACQ